MSLPARSTQRLSAFRCSFAAGLALLCLGTVACSSSFDRPSLLLITVDTLRHDHISANGHPYAKTPSLDRLAEQGVVFENHYTVVGLTEPAHVTIFTGLYPRQHGVRRNGLRLPAELSLFAETLEAEGYRTGASIGSGVLGSEFGLGRGFGSFVENFDRGNFDRGHARTGAFERYAEDVIDDAIEFLEAPSDAPLFLWVHLFDPHSPHVRPKASWPSIEELESGGAVLASPNELQHRAQLDRLRRGYTAEVRYTDSQIGRLIEAWDTRLEQRPQLVLFTADHGESLGEHSYIGHSFYLYEQMLRVPLILRMDKRLRAGRRVSSITSVVDVGATMFDLLGIDRPQNFGGSSLRRRLDGPDPNPDSFAIAERPPLPSASKLAREGKTRPADWKPSNLQDRLIKRLNGEAGSGELGLVAWIHGDWKFLWSEDAPNELYSLREDPHELKNRLDEPGLGARARDFRNRVESWREATPALYRAPKNNPAQTERVGEMLDALGYTGPEVDDE